MFIFNFFLVVSFLLYLPNICYKKCAIVTIFQKMADHQPPEPPLDAKAEQRRKNNIASKKSKEKKLLAQGEEELKRRRKILVDSRKKKKDERTPAEQLAFQAASSQRTRDSRARKAALARGEVPALALGVAALGLPGGPAPLPPAPPVAPPVAAAPPAPLPAAPPAPQVAPLPAPQVAPLPAVKPVSPFFYEFIYQLLYPVTIASTLPLPRHYHCLDVTIAS